MSLIKQKNKNGKIKNRQVAKKQVELLAVDFGCGENKVAKEYIQADMGVTVDKVIGIDFRKVLGVDLVHNLLVFPYPVENDSVDAVFSSHFVEHLDGGERVLFFNELYRIMKPGAIAKIITPHCRSVRAIQDPTHKWPPVAENFYFYLSKSWRTSQKLDHYLNLTCDFEIVGHRCGYTWQDPTVGSREESVRNFWVDKYSNIVADTIMVIKKI